jgi:lipopolysaccharide/colanic/teichoic acid biosynthesis glycosyltransferase
MPAIAWSRGTLVSLKPVTEWVLTAVTIPIWGTVVALLWLVVKLSAPRHPAFFMQPRSGVRGKRFKVFKIRTMVPNAEQLERQLAAHNLSSGPMFKMTNDPRVTRIGRVLRALHLDELPQLINVLKGEMRLVGARPSAAKLEDHKLWWRARLDKAPGVTGLFQIYRSDVHSFDDRARLDIAYLRKCSFLLDLQILVMTVIVALILRKGM